jgi:hypothetical protein
MYQILSVILYMCVCVYVCMEKAVKSMAVSNIIVVKNGVYVSVNL